MSARRCCSTTTRWISRRPPSACQRSEGGGTMPPPTPTKGRHAAARLPDRNARAGARGWAQPRAGDDVLEARQGREQPRLPEREVVQGKPAQPEALLPGRRDPDAAGRWRVEAAQGSPALSRRVSAHVAVALQRRQRSQRPRRDHSSGRSDRGARGRAVRDDRRKRRVGRPQDAAAHVDAHRRDAARWWRAAAPAPERAADVQAPEGRERDRRQDPGAARARDRGPHHRRGEVRRGGGNACRS